MEPDNDAWKQLKEATIVTMFFANQGLLKVRPLLEQVLRGRRCKVFTCGYPMPGWDPQMIETVLDMPIHFYDWGNPDIQDTFFNDSFLDIMPEMMNFPDKDRFLNKRKSTYMPDPLKGYHPDDLIDYGWDDFEDKETKTEAEALTAKGKPGF